MRVLIATDKFKGSLTAVEACEAMRDGIRKKYPHAEITVLPLADGGEGMSELLTHYTNGQIVTAQVAGPLFEKLNASYGLSGDGLTAFVESAKASGLQLIGPSSRNPLITTTLGTGELILDAISRGARTIMLGIGGTATNDAGTGVAYALGYRFLDKKGNPLEPTGQNLEHIRSIDRTAVNPNLKNISFVALCDVENPLYGTHGAAHTYAAQKGASDNDIEVLDLGLRNFEVVIKHSLQLDADFPGAGAGGGLASGAKVFLGASIRKAMDYIADVTGLDEKIRNADLVITGEGKIDTQTLSGKVVGNVARMAMQHNKKVIAVCGICELREIELGKIGIAKVISLTDPFTEPEVAMREARDIIVRKVSIEI